MTSSEFAMTPEADQSAPPLTPRLEGILLLIIVIVGGILRFTALDSVPPGLWFDEALNLQDAVIAANGGGLKLVYPDVFPREPMYETILVGVTKIFGPVLWHYRATSGVIGLLTILAAWWMMRRWVGQEVALLTAGVLATLRWHVIFSRLLFRTLMLPLWICLILIAAYEVRRKPTLHRSVLLGALIAGGFYTYLAWYFMMPGVIVLAVWAHGAFWRDPHLKRCAMCCLAAFLLFIAPLSRHYKKHPEHLLARAEAVSISPLADPAGAMREYGKNFGQALGMLHWRGDHVPKQNLPNAPALNLHEGIFLLIGIASLALLVRKRDVAAYGLLAWIALGISPTIFTKTDSPNFLRTLVLTPAVAAVVATGIVKSRELLAARAGFFASPTALIAITLSVVAVSASLTGMQVLRAWPASTEVWESFNGAQSQLGVSAAKTPDGTTYWVPSHIGDHRSFQFLSKPDPRKNEPKVKSYVNFNFLRADASNDGPRRVVATAHNGLLGVLERLAPQGAIVEEYKRPDGGVWAVLYEIEPGEIPDAALVAEAERAHSTDIRW